MLKLHNGGSERPLQEPAPHHPPCQVLPRAGFARNRSTGCFSPFKKTRIGGGVSPSLRLRPPVGGANVDACRSITASPSRSRTAPADLCHSRTPFFYLHGGMGGASSLRILSTRPKSFSPTFLTSLPRSSLTFCLCAMMAQLRSVSGGQMFC